MNGDIRELRHLISTITARLDRLEGVPPPPEPVSEHKPRVIPMWINDRLPNEYDSPSSDPRVYQWDATRGVYAVARWDVKPGEWWASGRLEKPTSPPPQPEPAPSRWITDRVPEINDTDRERNVLVPPRDGGYYVCIVDYLGVYPGTPWAPVNATPDGPWDPTTLDRNGWIRSRLPTKGDAHQSRGRVWIPCDASGHVGQHYTFVTPGQPWAPWGSKPGPYQP